MQELKLVLLGQPMPKQSVRGGKYGFYQPAKYKKREADYRLQINAQLPKDFVMMKEYVWIKSVTIVHNRLESHLKHKRKAAWLSIGGLIYKNTKPDLVDNLMKLVIDSMSEVNTKGKPYKKGVFVDDRIIVGCHQMFKFYGLNPRIEIELFGY